MFANIDTSAKAVKLMRACARIKWGRDKVEAKASVVSVYLSNQGKMKSKPTYWYIDDNVNTIKSFELWQQNRKKGQ